MSDLLVKLLTPGVVGTFQSFEAVEIFATPRGQQPINVLTVVVAEANEAPSEKPVFLTAKPIKVKAAPNWAIGVQRYRRPISELQAALDDLTAHFEWRPSGAPSKTGRLVTMPPIFVPPNSGEEVPLNRVLKNNFWNGSHVLEWGDREKDLLKPLLDNPRDLQTLSDAVEAVLPIRLAGLSDRLGHVVIQIPVTSVMALFGQDRAAGNPTIELAWADGVSPRPLIGGCRMEFDGILTGSGTAEITEGAVSLPPAGRGELRAFVWDDVHQLTIAATAPSSFTHTIDLNISMVDPEPRTFSIPMPDGTYDHRRVGLVAKPMISKIGDQFGDDAGGWTGKRIYQERATRLAEERVFKAYRPSGNPEADHAAAIDDLRLLIKRYGKDGAWLWDPYLGAREVFETLFYCPTSGVELRALTAGKSKTAKRAAFLAEQRTVLKSVTGNLRGLRLEFRARSGATGWPFHDRFLIFPAKEGAPLVWSLGTSVNGFGKEHHILQQVDNGQLIAESFEDLWGLLAGADDLIWKTA